jgi:hypothetical protein
VVPGQQQQQEQEGATLEMMDMAGQTEPAAMTTTSRSSSSSCRCRSSWKELYRRVGMVEAGFLRVCLVVVWMVNPSDMTCSSWKKSRRGTSCSISCPAPTTTSSNSSSSSSGG